MNLGLNEYKFDFFNNLYFVTRPIFYVRIRWNLARRPSEIPSIINRLPGYKIKLISGYSANCFYFGHFSRLGVEIPRYLYENFCSWITRAHNERKKNYYFWFFLTVSYTYNSLVHWAFLVGSWIRKKFIDIAYGFRMIVIVKGGSFKKLPLVTRT